ncbi:MAG: hypothetical protein AMJ79_10315 [Phycisphaerae bacterium SM23_30]|nr:MAG: hypothetical protein AMJ79_10315 [Phycisphaerae bacterium SM23_30]
MISRNYFNRFKFLVLVVFVLTLALLIQGCNSTGSITRSSAYNDSDQAQQRFAWRAQHEAMKKASPFKDLPFQFIGPEVMSGRSTDVDAHPSDRQIWYVTSASGGVWKTTDEGKTWQPILDIACSASVGDVAVAPSNPNIIWVGMGEANIFRSSMAGDGVYKSTNAGKTFRYMGLGDTQHVARIVIHPTDPDIVYVCAPGHEYTYNEERGIYKTIDGGRTWQQVFYKDEKTGSIDLVMDPKNPDTLYMSTCERLRRRWSDPLPSEQACVYKTTDGGMTWKPITNGLPENLAMCERIGLDVCASHPNVVYAMVNNLNPQPGAAGGVDSYGRPIRERAIGADLYRSDDYGVTWVRCQGSDAIGRNAATYGWVFGQVRVDPQDPDTVYCMGLGIMKTSDGGKTFTRFGGPGVHGDHHAMWIDPADSDYVINGNDGGINLTRDGGETWFNYENQPVIQFYNISYDMDTPFRVYGSVQDNGSYRGVVHLDQGRDLIPQIRWESAPGGEASYHAIDPTNPNLVYSESFYGSISRNEYDPEIGRFQSTNIRPREAEDEEPYRGQWLAPFIISPHDNNTIYHGMNFLFRSTDRGDNWEKISPDLTNYAPEKQGNIPYSTIFTIAESPLGRPGTIYVGTDDGNVWCTRNGGQDWQDINTGPTEHCVSRVAASHFFDGTVYMAKNGKRHDDFNVYLYKSDDYGQNWTDISAGIPGGPVNVIKEDPYNRNILYVGTDMGVYVSLDSGKNWHVLAEGLPPVTFVHDLIIHPRDHIMVIATHGHGVFALDVLPIRKAAR